MFRSDSQRKAVMASIHGLQKIAGRAFRPGAGRQYRWSPQIAAKSGDILMTKGLKGWRAVDPQMVARRATILRALGLDGYKGSRVGQFLARNAKITYPDFIGVNRVGATHLLSNTTPMITSTERRINPITAGGIAGTTLATAAIVKRRASTRSQRRATQAVSTYKRLQQSGSSYTPIMSQPRPVVIVRNKGRLEYRSH